MDLTKMSGCNFMTGLEGGLSHFCLDAGCAVHIFCVTLYIVEPKDGFFLNHVFKGILPRVSKLFVDEVEQRGND